MSAKVGQYFRLSNKNKGMDARCGKGMGLTMN